MSMSRESAGQALREIRALHALGTVGGLTDPQLVERYLGSQGTDREDAFAALVQRHGPMVLSVCRRMLGGSADVEDVFQAVFLVLARKAGAVRRLEGLKSWIYGVAVRTAREARRQSARRRQREGGAMDESKAVSTPGGGPDDLLEILDEEIDRLPRRYRDAVLLCELDGIPRQDAARQLGLAEGTLSSRLARGRSILRSRLTRRGATLGAGGIAAFLRGSANAAIPEPLARSTVQLALQFAAAGTIPAAASSLAEGVLAMMFAARMKLFLITMASLGGAACLTAGLAWAVMARPAVEPARPQPIPVAQAPKEHSDKENLEPVAQVRGVVVDETGRPVEGVEVRGNAFTARESQPAVTAADGSFTIAVPPRHVGGLVLLASLAGNDRLGFHQIGYNEAGAKAQEPVRIVLRPGREVAVRVADSSQAAVSDAAVQIAGNFAILDSRKTGPDGAARLHVPADATVEWIYALKSGKGFDYAEYGKFDEYGRSRGGASALSLPASVNLRLDGVRRARIKAVDAAGKPLAGARFRVWLVQKPGRKSEVNVSSRILEEMSGQDGIATFDWLPPSRDLLQFWPVDEGYAHRRVTVEEGQTAPVTTRLTRTETIRGRVTLPDGSPAPGIQVRAYGSGKGSDNGQDRIRTDASGSYTLTVNPDEAYAVYVDDKDWAAPSRLDVDIRAGKPVAGVDFRLTRGTLLHGKVTVGANRRPVADQYIILDETAGIAPEEFREPGDHTHREVRRQFGATTDASGRYSIRIGPGAYTIMGPPRTENEKITVKDEAEIIRDFQMPRPTKGTLTGRVVLAGSRDKGVADAVVEVAAANRLAIPFAVKADAQGRFQAERNLDPLVICARSPDGTLGAMVELGAEDPTVEIALSPTASATGVLLDEQGKPAANQKLYWGRRVYLDQEQRMSMVCFAPKVATDENGKFTLPSLVVGQEYEIAVQRDNMFPAAGAVRPEKPGPIDLGTLRIGAYSGKPRPTEEELSSFRKNAPGPGAVAPEIKAIRLDGESLSLSEFQGKYVLLDFWATWCGPCLGEIPNLQAVYQAFGHDPRFVLLSLSVDEKIDEPRKFQEKRKLPWLQAFLGGGVSSPMTDGFGIRAIPAFVLVGPDGKIVARGMRGKDIEQKVAEALARRIP